MSINSSLGQGMADVAGTAMLAHAIGQSNKERADLRESLKEWMAHAGQLQTRVHGLEEIISEQKMIIRRLQTKNLSLAEERDQVIARNIELSRHVNKLQSSSLERAELFTKQVEYMRDLKVRLAHTEKALRHSSGRSVGLDHLKDFLLHATRAVDNHELLHQQAMDVMERAYNQFIETGQLTPDEEMQAVLEELKVKAPDFKQGLAN